MADSGSRFRKVIFIQKKLNWVVALCLQHDDDVYNPTDDVYNALTKVLSHQGNSNKKYCNIESHLNASVPPVIKPMQDLPVEAKQCQSTAVNELDFCKQSIMYS